MKKGNLFKEKIEYEKEKFSSISGLLDFAISGAIWSFVILDYGQYIYDYAFSVFAFTNNVILQQYLAYLSFSLAATMIGLGISFGVFKIFERFLPGNKKNSQKSKE